MAFKKITKEIPLMDEEDNAEEDKREIFNRGLHGFINYFKKTYIGEIGMGCRKIPMFKNKYLSKNKRILENLHSLINNNSAKSFNK